MRNKLIERVARAIADKRNELIGLPPAWWGHGEWNGTDLVLTPNDRNRYRAEAAAALAAYDTDDRIKELREALEAVKAYYIDANPTKLTEAYVCDLVCTALKGDA
jgi:hypothetical protein